MAGFFLVIYIVVCIILIIAVLVQSGKGSSISGLFGGGGSDMFFGATGANKFLNRLTTVLGILFFVLSLLLAGSMSMRRRGPVRRVPVQQEMPLPQEGTQDIPLDPIRENVDIPVSEE